MEILDTHTSKEAAWRSRLQLHAQSGKSITAFCRDEAVSTASFHIWGGTLAVASGHAAPPAQPAAFIDLGTIASTAGVMSMAHTTCRLHDINPYDYFVDVVQRVGQHPASLVHQLTPRIWKEMFANNLLRSDLHDLDSRRTCTAA